MKRQSTNGSFQMNQMLKLSDKDFQGAIEKYLKINKNYLEIEKNKKILAKKQVI